MFAVVIRRRGQLWYVCGMYRDKRDQTVITGQWYMSRAEAANDAAYLIL